MGALVAGGSKGSGGGVVETIQKNMALSVSKPKLEMRIGGRRSLSSQAQRVPAGQQVFRKETVCRNDAKHKPAHFCVIIFPTMCMKVLMYRPTVVFKGFKQV